MNYIIEVNANKNDIFKSVFFFKSSNFETCHLNIKRCETKQLELYGIHWQLNHRTTQFEFLLEYPLPRPSKVCIDSTVMF